MIEEYMRINNKALWPIITFLAGTMLGSGALWEWGKLKLAQKDIELEENRLKMEENEFKLDFAAKTSALRSDIIQKQTQLIALSYDYNKAVGIYSRQRTSKNMNEANHIYSQVLILRDDINEAERKLAEIENRPPREIQVDFIPPGPILDFR